MQQKQRISKLDLFRNKAKNNQSIDQSKNKTGKARTGNVLLCTDVGARGLDIPEVDIVINYHIPLSSENFVHRSGRTARANKTGQCLNFVSEKELNLYKKILRELKIYEISLKTMPLTQLDQYKSMFDHVKKLEKESFLHNKHLREKEWIKKQAAKCDIIPDENLLEELELKEKQQLSNGRSRGNSKFFDTENNGKVKMLNKKRKTQLNLNYIENKKLQQKIMSHDISRSSYLNPSSVPILNKLLNSSEKLKAINLTETLRNANDDLLGAKNARHRKTRHVKRRRGNN